MCYKRQDFYSGKIYTHHKDHFPTVDSIFLLGSVYM